MRISVILTAAMLTVTLSGCSFTERVCSEGENPALALENGKLVGGVCVPEGQEPPPGFVRYPQDLEPTMLKDQDAATKAFQARLDQQR